MDKTQGSNCSSPTDASSAQWVPLFTKPLKLKPLSLADAKGGNELHVPKTRARVAEMKEPATTEPADLTAQVSLGPKPLKGKRYTPESELLWAITRHEDIETIRRIGAECAKHNPLAFKKQINPSLPCPFTACVVHDNLAALKYMIEEVDSAIFDLDRDVSREILAASMDKAIEHHHDAIIKYLIADVGVDRDCTLAPPTKLAQHGLPESLEWRLEHMSASKVSMERMVRLCKICLERAVAADSTSTPSNMEVVIVLLTFGGHALRGSDVLLDILAIALASARFPEANAIFTAWRCHGGLSSPLDEARIVSAWRFASTFPQSAWICEYLEEKVPHLVPVESPNNDNNTGPRLQKDEYPRPPAYYPADADYCEVDSAELALYGEHLEQGRRSAEDAEADAQMAAAVKAYQDSEEDGWVTVNVGSDNRRRWQPRGPAFSADGDVLEEQIVPLVLQVPQPSAWIAIDTRAQVQCSFPGRSGQVRAGALGSTCTDSFALPEAASLVVLGRRQVPLPKQEPSRTDDTLSPVTKQTAWALSVCFAGPIGSQNISLPSRLRQPDPGFALPQSTFLDLGHRHLDADTQQPAKTAGKTSTMASGQDATTALSVDDSEPEPSTTEQQPTSFPQFARLPPEIQLLIWQKALEEPAFVVWCDEHDHCEKLLKSASLRLARATCSHDRRPHPLMHTCHASRRVARPNIYHHVLEAASPTGALMQFRMPTSTNITADVFLLPFKRDEWAVELPKGIKHVGFMCAEHAPPHLSPFTGAAFGSDVSRDNFPESLEGRSTWLAYNIFLVQQSYVWLRRLLRWKECNAESLSSCTLIFPDSYWWHDQLDGYGPFRYVTPYVDAQLIKQEYRHIWQATQYFVGGPYSADMVPSNSNVFIAYWKLATWDKSARTRPQPRYMPFTSDGWVEAIQK
ncbi:uncharacterized protein B0I36DRAFT_345130 [Microdochium trichocladiopsis]|uniref:2EXR domain-containing protein n=1 Tax=Microdochium trichocladiopsis TaxID=1682393 RepID=A0A9P8YKF9_9PEZI|nr:uncharacterized protein B0I36DRAFT_345130 [Microdochium trichocladiopsis]KAH7041538.1 hypothetical protein B0I36DRAFT_345130 [Microdochium trichocladiopsis]